MIKISAGTLKGKGFKHKRYQQIRPTQTLVRQALFNILGHAVQGCRFLDVFAGTGAIGLEAYSCGARCVIFIEANRPLAALLKQHLIDLNVPGMVIPKHYKKAFYFLSHHHKNPFDVIYLDPPYPFEDHNGLLQDVTQHKLLHTDGTLILERSTHHVPPSQNAALHGLKPINTRQYGQCVLDFYQYSQAPH